MNTESDSALVVLSGGQDSTTCLYWAMHRFGAERVQTVTFDYGQRHRVELGLRLDAVETDVEVDGDHAIADVSLRFVTSRPRATGGIR